MSNGDIAALVVAICLSARRRARLRSTPRSRGCRSRGSRSSCARTARVREALARDRRRPRPLRQPAAPAARRLRADRHGARHDRRARRSGGGRWPVVLLTVLVMIVVVYVALGVGPRTLGRQHADRVALATAAPAARARPRVRPARVAAHPARQRDHAGQGLPRRAVRVPGRAARARRPRRGERRHRGRRAADDPVGLRARRHDRARGHGAAHRDGLDRAHQDGAARRSRSRCAAASRASR